MAYIAPNSTIMICRDVPLSPDYIHTVDFANSTLQSAYFTTKAKFTLEKYSYQRKNGVLTVALSTEHLYDCNYIAYKNTSFENKWFYGFIRNIEYVSNDVTNIYFVEDVFQTWMFDYSLNPCFIDREHTLNDKIGSNIIPESLELGPYITETQSTFDCGSLNNLCFIIAAAVSLNITIVDNHLNIDVSPYEGESAYNYNNYVFEGLCLNVIKAVTIAGNTTPASAVCGSCVEAIQKAGYQDSIVAITAAPLNFVTDALSNPHHFAEFTWNVAKPYSNIATYKPKNNKLFTSPYKFLNVVNDDAVEQNFEYELFSGDFASFNIMGAMQINFSTQLRPNKYKNNPRPGAALVVTNYPNCSYIIDTYKTWYAQNQIRYKTAITKAVISGALSIGGAAVGMNYTGKRGDLDRAYAKRRYDMRRIDMAESQSYANTALTAAEAVANVGEIVLDNMAEKQIHQINNLSASYSGDDLNNCSLGYKGYIANGISITPQYAQMIDNYFSMFGYKTNQVKIPNTTGRLSWNYVKTVGCDVQGSIPQYAVEAINAIFNTGITIWHNAAWVGDYTRDNRITGNG